MITENPFAILAVGIFAASVAACGFGPAHWGTGRPKPKFALAGVCFLLVGVTAFVLISLT